MDFLDDEDVVVEHVSAARYTFLGPGLASYRTRALVKSNMTQIVPAKNYNKNCDSNKDQTQKALPKQKTQH